MARRFRGRGRRSFGRGRGRRRMGRRRFVARRRRALGSRPYQTIGYRF